MDQKLYDLIEASPVIAAVKDMEGLNACCGAEDVKVVFVLFGDICNIGSIVKRIKQAGKVVMVHIDLITGLSSKEIAVDFIKNNTEVYGIISTKPSMIKRAKELSLYTMLRIFILDSMAFENIEKQVNMVRPDMIEILPGLMPKIIRRVSRLVKVPVIAGGLISEKEDVMAALLAGAISVSSTNQDVWRL
ncbi:glycerol-3-phosphate responsive antiterminator [Lacrimispora sp.]|uniref:glycerol-3-phosphate responsive antiterminator n=1 Tax=Lacrimispora sp. TaxID=2719234 RepID=UPI0034601E9E